VAAWVKQIKYTFPVLLDPEGKVSATYAPPGVQPDLARDQVPIASNLIIDKDGKVRFYSLLDSVHFDAKLSALTARLDQFLAAK
jgi:peroxiredoxin